MVNNLSLHHIGVATKSIAQELRCFEALGYSARSEIFADPKQKIRGLFIAAPGQPVLELLENTTSPGPLDSCLKHGIKLYHFAYAVKDIQASCKEMAQKAGAKVIVPVTEAVYFRYVCFLMLPNMMLVELVQEPLQPE